MRFKYDVAISYANVDKDNVIAENLKKIVRLGWNGNKIYDYRDHTVKQVGKDLINIITEVYRKQSRTVLVLVSKDYAENEYTKKEWEQIRAEQSDRGSKLYIIFLSIDGTTLPGQSPTILFIDWAKGTTTVGEIIRSAIAPSNFLRRLRVGLLAFLFVIAAAVCVDSLPGYRLSWEPPFIKNVPQDINDTTRSKTPIEVGEKTVNLELFNEKGIHNGVTVYLNNTAIGSLNGNRYIIDDLKHDDQVRVGNKENPIFHITIAENDLKSQTKQIELPPPPPITMILSRYSSHFQGAKISKNDTVFLDNFDELNKVITGLRLGDKIKVEIGSDWKSITINQNIIQNDTIRKTLR